MKKKLVVVFILISVFVVAALFFVRMYQRSIVDREGVFVDESIRALCGAFGIEKDAISKTIDAAGIHSLIRIPCNFDIKKIQNVIIGYFEKEGYKSRYVSERDGILSMTGEHGRRLEVVFISDAPVGRVVLIIENVGYNIDRLYRFFDLGIPITFSVLPKLSFSKRISSLLDDHGYPYILHQPLDVSDGYKPITDKPVVFSIKDTPETIEKIFLQNIASLGGGGVIGVSLDKVAFFRKNQKSMNTFLNLVKKYNMFFVDTGTGLSAAEKKNIKDKDISYFENDIVLDEKNTLSYIETSLNELIERAIQNTSVIAVAQEESIMLVSAIEKMLPIFNEKRVKFVFLRDMQ